jgi:hypothetical protein
VNHQETIPRVTGIRSGEPGIIVATTDKDKDEFPAMTSAMKALKLSPESIQEWHETVASIAKMAGTVSSAVGAVSAVMGIYESLFVHKESTDSKIDRLVSDIQRIYKHLLLSEHLRVQAIGADYRAGRTSARVAIDNGRHWPRTQPLLDDLMGARAPLDTLLAKMLDPTSGDVAFVRQVYGNPAAWIDACASPYLNYAGPESQDLPLNFRDPQSEMTEKIWDPGHYLPTLLEGIADRLALLRVCEPAFKSTGFDRSALNQLHIGLTVFIRRWRDRVIVASPLACLNGDGPLAHPQMTAPFGICVGAVDPLTGISCFQPFWGDFQLQSVYHGSVEAKGRPDETYAVDPRSVRAQALDVQAAAHQALLAACGIGKFEELRDNIGQLLSFSSTGSDFVDLAGPWFGLLSMSGPSDQPETVSLGLIGNLGTSPGREYAGRRYHQQVEKEIQFQAAMRAEVSGVQLGYRMEVFGQSIDLIAFSREAVPLGAPRFRSGSFSVDVWSDQWSTFDVYQDRLFSAYDEDRFEGALPPPAARITPEKFPARIVKEKIVRPGSPQRLYLNERKGRGSLSVTVRFSDEQKEGEPHVAGQVTVTIRNLDPTRNSRGLIVPVSVYETRVGPDGNKEEVVADSMTVHIAPSFLVVDQQYFADRRQGLDRLELLVDQIDERFTVSEPSAVPPTPQWNQYRRLHEVERKVAALESAISQSDAQALNLMRYFGHRGSSMNQRPE